jgi:integrase
VRDPATGRLGSLGTFTAKADADVAIAMAIADQRRGGYVGPGRDRIRLERWVEDHWWPSKQHLRPTSLAQYRYLLDTLVLPDLGRTELGRLDAQIIARWRSGLLRQPNLSASTVAKAYRVLRQALAAAVEARYLAVNPASIKGAAVEPRSDLVVPTIDEALALAAAMPERLRLLVLLYGFAGLRLGEAQALRRRHVDLGLRTVRVEETVSEVSGAVYIGPPKTSAGLRTVDLPAVVADAAQLHLDEFAEPGPDGLLFVDRVGGPQRRRTIYTHWWRARATVGIDGVRLHDLRHLAGTLGTITGATTKEQMARLGHSSAAAALRYQHVVEGRGKVIALGIDRLVDEAESAAQRRRREKS